MKKRKIPHTETYKVNMFHYIVQGKLSHFLSRLNVSMEELDLVALDRVSKSFTVEIARNHSKSSLAKACLAQFYVKKENAYLLANNLIDEVLNSNPSFAVKISLSLIRFDLQKKLYMEYSNQGQDESAGGGPGLNILQFVRTNKRFENIKMRMKKQVKIQLDFWQNYLASKPDMGELVELALKVNGIKNAIKEDWKELLKLKSSHFIYPYLVYGMYISLANNDAIEGEKFTDAYSKEYAKYGKISQIDEMNNKTLFCENTVQISMSGSRTKLGRILGCSSNIAQSYGWKREFLVDRPVNLLMSGYYRHKHDRMLLNHFNTGHTRLLNNTVKMPVQNSEGFMCPSWMHIKMNPIVEQGISYIAVMRPLKYAPMSVLVRKDGTIDSITKNLAELMNIAKHPDLHNMKIFTICPDFKPVNTAFNVVINKMFKDNMSSSKGGDSQTLESQPDDRSEDMSQNDITKLGFGKTMTAKGFSSPSIARGGEQSRGSISFPQVLDTEMKSQNIYDSFTAGAHLVFHPQKNFSVEGNKIKIFADDNYMNDAQPMTFNVRILTRAYEKDPLKILVLENIDKSQEIANNYKDKNIVQTQTMTYIPEKDEEQIQSRGDDFNLQRAPLNSDSRMLMMSPKDPQIMSNRLPLTSDSRLIILSAKDNGNDRLLLSPHQNEDRPLPTEMSRTTVSNIPDEVLSQDNRQMLQQDYSSRGYQDDLEENLNHPRHKKVSPIIREEEALEEDEEEGGENHVVDLGKTSVLTFGKNSFSNKKFAQVVAQAREVYHHKTSFLSNQHKSSHEEKVREPRQEENLLRAKLRRLREKLNQGIADAKGEGSIASSYLSKGKKAQTLVTEALTIVVHRRSTVIFNASFFVFILVVLGLQIFQAINIFDAIKDIKSKTDVLGNGGNKLNSLMMVNFYARIYDGVNKGMYTINNNMSEDIAQAKTEVQLYARQLYKYNNLLINDVSTLSTQFQDVFYAENIRVYETQDNNTKVLVSTDTNFEVTTKIIDRAIGVVASETKTMGFFMAPDTNLQFILDNTLDDMLVSSETSLDALTEDLNESLDHIHKRILATYLLVIAALVCFFGVTVQFVLQMRAHSVRFSSLFFRLENNEAEEIKTLLQQFVSSLDNMKSIDIPDEEKEAPLDKAKSSHLTRTLFRQPVMTKYYKAQILVVSRLLPFYLIVAGWTLGYYVNTNSIMNKIVEQEEQIHISLDTLYLQNLIMTEFTGLLLTNGSITVRNQDVAIDFLYNLGQLPSANAMVNAFRSSDGTLNSAQQEAFYNFPCESFSKYSIDNLDYVLDSCVTMSKGTNSVSLIESLSLLYSTTTEYYQRYDDSSKTMGEIIEINKDFLSVLQTLGAVSPAMCTVLYQITLEDFVSQTNSANVNAIVFTVVTIVALILGTIGVWHFIIKRIFEFESSDKKILKLVPVKIILSNKYLKQYLIQNSHGKFQRMKHFLQ